MKLIKTITSIPLLLTTLTSQILLHTPVTAQTATPLLCAVPGKDGVRTLAGVINTYYAGAGTASRGTDTINVGAINLDGSQTPIAAGDLLLIIQMQGANINSTNTDSYGDGTSGGGNDGDLRIIPNPNGANGNLGDDEFTAGNYEYVVATKVSGSSITIRGAGSNSGLINTYSSAPFGAQGQRTYQVIRVPQYSNATLTSSLTAARWNGSSGGVLVYDVAGNTNLGNNTTVDVSGIGFRGGGAYQYQGAARGLTSRDYRTLSTATANSSKGEGTAGTPRYVFNRVNNTRTDNGVANEGYPDGSFGRGAPGNAGGGGTDGNPAASIGNNENSGGGGGGNGGSGGMGGRSFRSALAVGGFGGARFPASSGRVVMGGGGGAGTTNDATSDPPDSIPDGIASSGASGGGVVLIRTGTISGSATVNASGADALNVGRDGGGGGGAGGSVVITAANTVNNSLDRLTVDANGGKGGDAKFGLLHGPGGGGGGGVILTNLPAQRNDNGGANGGTSDPVDPRMNFGATRGSDTIPLDENSIPIPGANSGAECVPQLTVNKTTSTPRITNKPGKAIYTITVSNAANRATATNVVISDPLPTGFTFDASTPPTVTLINSANEPTARNTIMNPEAGATTADFGTFNIPGGGSVQITFSVDVGVNVPDNTYNNDAIATYIDPTLDTPGSNPTTTNIARSRYDGNISTTEDVIVSQLPPPPPTPVVNIRGVKRITNVIRNGVPLAGVNFGVVIDDPSDINDDASIWANSQLAPVGVTRIDPQLKLRAGDEVEYTVYFLVDGNEPITNARFCDPIPQGTSFISNSGSDITLNIANTITNQTNIADADRASLVNAVAPLPANNVCPNQSNPTGAVLVNFGTLDSTPGNNFGYTRFRVRVD
ncbi:hypothetical protein DSM106972_012880 [Dulcicalothrix desertica PCC 7102]|uniref:DUF11 domain-containing protein n=1 Tax=Dulcicalothrix desertica PCC 7102 TaxID=232991 RepID=A0A433VT69_9CYAN|nr:DUF11 domain-containing protein [Dulcicalothrix desertica]RUT09235.1 hypothetical protein DSM106972_012880 [Dulcicalothrix desertica PCC 7102]TWH55011.1 putative repeat protein (TIGR01451 family) [Dulcicalothrix desertica PCC 7102]